MPPWRKTTVLSRSRARIWRVFRSPTRTTCADAIDPTKTIATTKASGRKCIPSPDRWTSDRWPRGEAAHGGRLVFERLEHHHQLHRPEKPLAAAREVHQPEVTAALAHMFQFRRQHADPGAVDERHAA